MSQIFTPWRSWRLSFPKLSLRQVAKAVDIEPWRLSLIERGVPATDDETNRLRAFYVAKGAV